MPTATFHTSKGAFTVSLMPEHAPKTVANFVGLATGTKAWTDPRDGASREEPLYPGTIFHRVIDGFMIQGGDPTGTGTGGPGYTFEDECPPDGPTFNQVGRLAMANAGPGTNGCQFFLTIAETPWLNGRHTIFGQVTEGYDVVETIGNVATGRARPTRRRHRDRADRDRRLSNVGSHEDHALGVCVQLAPARIGAQGIDERRLMAARRDDHVHPSAIEERGPTGVRT